MTAVRPFMREDVPGVAALFTRVFRRTTNPPASLGEYFQHLYFHNPWYDEAFPSLVCQSADKRIVGFLGVIPFPMVFEGKRITAAIGGNYMVDPDAKNPFAGGLLLRKLFAGPQSLTMSDTGNDAGRRMWTQLGAETSDLYSLHWIRVLKPARFAASMGGRSRGLRAVETILRPFSVAVDTIASSIPQSPFRVKHMNGQVTAPLEEREMYDALPEFREGMHLFPDYTAQTLAWVLHAATEKREYGPLVRVVVRDKKEAVAGWFLYYPNPGRTGQVLQLAGRPETMENVLDHLFSHAYSHGSIALIGRAVPGYIKLFSEKLCIFYHRSHYFLMFSRNRRILDAVHQGNAFLTRLDGEWWTRLQGDDFD